MWGIGGTIPSDRCVGDRGASKREDLRGCALECAGGVAPREVSNNRPECNCVFGT